MPPLTCFALEIAKVKLKILQTGHAAELGRGVSVVDPLRQQVAAVREVQEILPILARVALEVQALHLPPQACPARENDGH